MRITLGILIIGLLARLALGAPLSDAINEIGTDVTAVSTETENVSNDIGSLISKYHMTNAGKCDLLVVGISSTSSVPIYFVPGPFPVSALQADVIADSVITVSSITDGPDLSSMGKSIASAPIPGGRRFVLAGLNQNLLTLGAIATVSLDMTKAFTGSHILALVNFVASSPLGTEVPMCVTTGVITK